MVSGRIVWRRLWWVGLLAVSVSLIVNLLIRTIGIALFHLSPAFGPLGVIPIVFWSIVAGVGAVLVFALVGRFSRNPIPLFLIIAIIVYCATFYPDYLLLFADLPMFAGATIYSVGTLLTMHLAEAAITVCILILLGFERKSKNKKVH